MEPLVLGIRPVIALNKVVLPPPFGPTTAMRLFLFTEKLTSSKINVSPISTQHELDIIVLFTKFYLSQICGSYGEFNKNHKIFSMTTL